MKKKLFILLSLSFFLTGCNNNLPKNMSIILSESINMEYEKYQNEYITTMVPKGYVVDVYPADASHYTFKIYNPNNPNYLIFFNFKTDGFTKTYEDRNKYMIEKKDSKEAKLPTLENKSTSNYFSKWNEIASANDIASFKVPRLNNLSISEVINKDEEYGEIITGTYLNSEGKLQEGIFSVNITENENDFVSYNTIIITSPIEEFINYEEILLNSILNLKFSDKFIKETNIEEFDNSIYKSIASIASASYKNRSSEYAIKLQEESDTALGYIRVYNIKNNKIYKADSNFFDYYEDDEYIKVSDDMYLKPIEGFIKID